IPRRVTRGPSDPPCHPWASLRTDASGRPALPHGDWPAITHTGRGDDWGRDQGQVNPRGQAGWLASSTIRPRLDDVRRRWAPSGGQLAAPNADGSNRRARTGVASLTCRACVCLRAPEAVGAARSPEVAGGAGFV